MSVFELSSSEVIRVSDSQMDIFRIIQIILGSFLIYCMIFMYLTVKNTIFLMQLSIPMLEKYC